MGKLQVRRNIVYSIKKLTVKEAKHGSDDEFIKKVKEGIVTESGNCPVTPGLTLFQGKWTDQVLYVLCIHDSIRFGEMKRNLPGITNTMLTATLKALEAKGIVHRKLFNEIPPHTEYDFYGDGTTE